MSDLKKTVTVLLVANREYNSVSVDFSFLNNDYEVRFEYLTIDNHRQIIDSIDRESYIINLCDGIDSEGQAGECVVNYLHEQNRIYTGCSPRNYQWKKSDIKKYNVSTPAYLIIERGCDPAGLSEQDVSHMRYPVIVKPDYNGGSMGITEKSRVDNLEDMKKQLAETLEKFPSAIAEEFIAGREFTALVCENPSDLNDPLVLEPMECVFSGSETFKHYNLKWIDWRTIAYNPIEDPELERRIMDFVRNLFLEMDIDGYVRFDLRMDINNNLYVCDVNPYCGLYYPPDQYGSADLIIVNSKKTNHRAFTDHIMFCAVQRHNKRSVNLTAAAPE